MKRIGPGLFIHDDEIRKRFGDRADEIISRLEANPDTQHKFSGLRTLRADPSSCEL